MSQADTGLRERKKRQTRDTIVRVATELFLERGFEATTIADIAAAADIAPRTFFGYFASKEAVVFHDFEEVFATFAERLRGRPAGETAFDAMREWIVEHAAAVGLDTEAKRCWRRLIRETPALQAHERSNLARFEALLAEGVAADLGVPPDSLRAHLVSAAAVAALYALGSSDDASAARGTEHAVAVMDEALVFLRGGLDALRRHPPI
ncbi:MAG: TetR family transcriptional regulator [Solirubrobacteraceae bacterium]|nr:TetR family transcriptional regulator [Solirubrobacteraceae bacterium]